MENFQNWNEHFKHINQMDEFMSPSLADTLVHSVPFQDLKSSEVKLFCFIRRVILSEKLCWENKTRFSLATNNKLMLFAPLNAKWKYSRNVSWIIQRKTKLALN